MHVSLLGTGTSTGIPALGCECPVCSSEDPRDRRFRASALFQKGDVRILADTGPEFRLQALRAEFSTLNAVLYTHNHADHINGIDDLRMISFNTKKPVECYGPPHTMNYLRNAFRYIWEAPDLGGGLPELVLHEIDGPFEVCDVKITPIPVEHTVIPTFGYRVENAAYIPDVKYIPPDSMASLRDLDVLVLDALRKEPHPTHLCLEESVAFAREIGAKRTYFTHIAHSMGTHASIELPRGMELGWDGLTIEC